MNCNTTHYRANSSSVPGDPTLKGKSVIDLACGEGFYTRLLRLHGAEYTLGVDLSQGMIDLAQKQETAEPLGIEYRQGDCRELKLDRQFDVVVAAYLLNYARDARELGAMVRGAVRCLKPGGRFVSVNSNPACDWRRLPSYRKYGFETSVAVDFSLEGELAEGTPVTWTFFLEDGSFSIENYKLAIATHEEAFRQAEFCHWRWHPARVSAAGTAEFGAEHWATFLAQPPVTFIECVK